MRSPGSRGLLPLLMICCTGISGVQALAASSPTFTVAATNVNMPSNGSEGTTQFTLASVNGYSGHLVLSCQYAGGEMSAKPPICPTFTAALHTLNAGQTVTGTLPLWPWGTPVPASLHPGRLMWPGRAPVLGLAVACVWLIRRNGRGKAGSWLALGVLGLVFMAGVAACSSGNSLAGTYPFTVTATDVNSQASVSGSFTVTVP